MDWIKMFGLRTIILASTVLAFNVCHAQSGWSVVERGLDYKVLQMTNNVSGTNCIHRVVAMATGLNYTNSYGQLVESSEEITLQPDGSAIATQGRHQVHFPSDIYNGVFQVTTPDGRNLFSRPMFICFDDGSNTVVIASLTNSIGLLTAANQITYRDCFSGIHADIVATYKRTGFECDLLFHSRPGDPELYGLSSSGTTIELVTEFFNTDEPQQAPGMTDDWYGLQDSTLKFGKLTMTHGKAFSIGIASTNSSPSNSNDQPPAPVYKSWVHTTDGRKFLVEQVPLASLLDQLNTLPLSASISKPGTGIPHMAAGTPASGLNRPQPAVQHSASLLALKRAATSMASAARNTNENFVRFASIHPVFPPDHTILNETNHILLAAADFKRQPGVVLDYNEVVSSGDDFDFASGQTYVISGDVYLSGTTTFEGAVLKFDGSGSLHVSGPVNGGGTIFTTIMDDSFGESTSSLNPDWPPDLGSWTWNGENEMYVTALDINAYNSGPVKLDGMQFYYATTAISLEGGDTSTLNDMTMNGCHATLYQECNVVNATNWNISYPDTSNYSFIGYYFDLNGEEFSINGMSCIVAFDLRDYESDPFSPWSHIVLADSSVSGSFCPAGPITVTLNPDLSSNGDPNGDGVPDWWELQYFGTTGLPWAKLDSQGVNTLGYDYTNGLDPNVITFSVRCTNNYTASMYANLGLDITAGVPNYYAVLVDDSNLGDAVWQPYCSSSITVNLGSTQGSHDVRVGLKGIASTATPAWEETTLVLASETPTISITSPANNSTFNTTRVNVVGTFTEPNLHNITVNGVPAYVSGNSFEAMNVPLAQGANTVTAAVQNLAGVTTTASITVTGGSSQVDPVQLQVSPGGGFTPLVVTFTPTASVPGTLQQVLYDFNGDGIYDQTATSLNPISHTYSSAGGYFPVVTVVTDAGRFSSSGGWNSSDPNRLQINVQLPPTVQNTISVTDPVDLKCDASGNVYVLSASTATITEYNSSGVVIRSLANIGTSPQGLDVDSSGNVYVAITGNNQVWKFNPAGSSFAADTTFGSAGAIGGFNAPFDVAVSPDGGTISVSDSGNNQIKQFTSTGQYTTSFGSSGTALGQFNTPQGLSYDASGYLYIVDTGNNRIALALSGTVIGTTGTMGSGFGQFQGPANLGVGDRGIYVADAGNNRVESFTAITTGGGGLGAPFQFRLAISSQLGLSQPHAVTSIADLLTEKIYIADTGNNRVISCTIPNTDSDALQTVWNNMVSHVNTGDFVGASSYFSVASSDNYLQTFRAVGSANTASAINQVGTLNPVYIYDDRAEYYFTSSIQGQTIGFPVEFDKENGLWKILEF